MRRMLRSVVSCTALVGATLLFAPVSGAFEATVGNVDIEGIQAPPGAGTVIIAPGGVVSIFAPIPLPSPPTLVLEGTIFNKRSGRPVQGVLLARAFPTAHPAPAPAGAIALSGEDVYLVDPELLPRRFVATVGSDANGLYSTTANVTQFAGVIAYCVYRPWKAEPGDERTVSSTATLPNVYTPYLRRDLYLNLPAYISKCDPVLTYQRFLADQGL